MRMNTLVDKRSIVDAKLSMRRLLREVESVTFAEMENFRVNVETKAKAQVPYLTGKLHDSIRVRHSKDKRRPEINISAMARSVQWVREGVVVPGGENYAPIQHENVHFKHPGGRKSHFLSDPYNEEVKRFADRVSRRLK